MKSEDVILECCYVLLHAGVGDKRNCKYIQWFEYVDARLNGTCEGSCAPNSEQLNARKACLCSFFPELKLKRRGFSWPTDSGFCLIEREDRMGGGNGNVLEGGTRNPKKKPISGGNRVGEE